MDALSRYLHTHRTAWAKPNDLIEFLELSVHLLLCHGSKPTITVDQYLHAIQQQKGRANNHIFMPFATTYGARGGNVGQRLLEQRENERRQAERQAQTELRRSNKHQHQPDEYYTCTLPKGNGEAACGVKLLKLNRIAHEKGIHGMHGALQCSVCGSFWAAKLHLEVHMRSHSGDQPFWCALCDNRFTTRAGAIVHIETLHPGSDPRRNRFFYQGLGIKPAVDDASAIAG